MFSSRDQSWNVFCNFKRIFSKYNLKKSKTDYKENMRPIDMRKLQRLLRIYLKLGFATSIIFHFFFLLFDCFFCMWRCYISFVFLISVCLFVFIVFKSMRWLPLRYNHSHLVSHTFLFDYHLLLEGLLHRRPPILSVRFCLSFALQGWLC